MALLAEARHLAAAATNTALAEVSAQIAALDERGDPAGVYAALTASTTAQRIELEAIIAWERECWEQVIAGRRRPTGPSE